MVTNEEGEYLASSLEEWSDNERARLSAHALEYDLCQLALVLLTSTSAVELSNAVIDDLRPMGHEEAIALAAPAGILVGEALHVIKSVAKAALAQQVGDDN